MSEPVSEVWVGSDQAKLRNGSKDVKLAVYDARMRYIPQAPVTHPRLAHPPKRGRNGDSSLDSPLAVVHVSNSLYLPLTSEA